MSMIVFEGKAIVRNLSTLYILRLPCHPYQKRDTRRKNLFDNSAASQLKRKWDLSFS